MALPGPLGHAGAADEARVAEPGGEVGMADGEERARSGRWTPEQLGGLHRTAELEVAVRRPDGHEGRWTPVWVVVVGEQVLLRTWQRRDTGWYGGVLRTGAAHVRIPGMRAEVVVEPADARSRAAVDKAYAAKYGREGARSMITEEAAASTLRLTPAPG
jgi:hypothetical protein